MDPVRGAVPGALDRLRAGGQAAAHAQREDEQGSGNEEQPVSHPLPIGRRRRFPNPGTYDWRDERHR